MMIEVGMHEGEIGFFGNYIEPVVDHPIAQGAYFVVAECVKMFAVHKFLELLTITYLHESTTMSANEIYATVVLIPLIEELIFRLAIQRGIQLGQHLLSRPDLTEEELYYKKTWRIFFSALIFSAVHATNNTSAEGALIQCSWTFMCGIVESELSEKYNTLSVSFLAHGINNALTSLMRLKPSLAPCCICACLVSKLAFYVLCIKTSAADDLVEKAKEGIGYCATLPWKVVQLFAPGE